MKHIAQSTVALLLVTGLAFGGVTSGLRGGSMEAKGGIGCCRDVI